MFVLIVAGNGGQGRRPLHGGMGSEQCKANKGRRRCSVQRVRDHREGQKNISSAGVVS